MGGVDIDSDSRAVIAADFNGDAKPDLLVGSAGGGSLRLFENQIKNGNRHIRLKLIGADSNRPGIGSRIEVTAGGRRIRLSLLPDTVFSGQAPVYWLIGVGATATIDRLVVRWPSGAVQTIEDLAADTEITLREGDPAPEITPFR